MPITTLNGVGFYQSPLLLQFPEIRHGFTCRFGGVSTGAYESLSMSPRRGDDPSAVRQNEAIAAHALGVCGNCLTATRQEHTDVVELLTPAQIGVGIQTPWDHAVDGLICTLQGVPILAYAADCVPILLYAPNIGAIGAVHAGWRGTASAIVQKAVRAMTARGADPKRIYAVIGPAIGPCCYEVDAPVAEACGCAAAVGGGKFMVDLPAANRRLLEAEGLLPSNIDNCAICTKCNNDLFFSHRGQGGKSGTLGALIQRN